MSKKNFFPTTSACKKVCYSAGDFASDAELESCSQEDSDYQDSIVSSQADVMSTHYADDDWSATDVSIGDACIDRAWSMYGEHKKSFYQKYTPLWEAVKGTRHLITDEKYNTILSVLQSKPLKSDSMNMRKFRNIYSLQGNVENFCIAHDGKTVTTFERVFDVILMAHQKLGYARDVKKNKNTVNDDLMFYGVPRVCVKCFIDTCPIVSNNC
jgi:hypothetical protein